jgi:hypothetical protein
MPKGGSRSLFGGRSHRPRRFNRARPTPRACVGRRPGRGARLDRRRTACRKRREMRVGTAYLARAGISVVAAAHRTCPRPRGRRLRLIPRTGGRAPPPHRDSAAAWTTRVRLEGPTTMSPGYLVGCLLRGRAQLGVVSSRGWAVSLNWTAPWMGWKRGPGRWPACGFEPSRSPMGRSRSGIEPL